MNQAQKEKEDEEEKNIDPNDTAFLGQKSLKTLSKNKEALLTAEEELRMNNTEFNRIDPLFQKLTSMLDSGGFNGLLLNCLQRDKKMTFHTVNFQSQMTQSQSDDLQIAESDSSAGLLLLNSFELIKETRLCPEIGKFRNYFKDVHLLE